jgi:hypothetical protein
VASALASFNMNIVGSIEVVSEFRRIAGSPDRRIAGSPDRMTAEVPRGLKLCSNQTGSIVALKALGHPKARIDQ